MVFSSVIFLFFFLPIVLSIYLLIGRKFRDLVLLLSSLVFYFWGEGNYVLIIILYMIFNYYFGVCIEKFRLKETNDGEKKAKIVLILSIVFNLGLLLYFKYFNFTVNNINTILKFTGISLNISQIHLPIGISFFTFQALSYVIDIYRRDVKPQKDIIKFSMYKGLFPQLIAGPIIRYRDIDLQINKRTITIEKFYQGIKRFIIGLGKKVLIANTLATVADPIFKLQSNELFFSTAWLGIICYAFQIYFDFSGYSDMAIGLGKMLGFDFLENFNYPYISKSIIIFWRRWHISLSSWFRDYLFKPMGGDRVSKFSTYSVLVIIVFFLCGLWHGAAWTFVIWGLYHGFFLVIERTGFGRFVKSMPGILQHTYAILAIIVGWVIFRSNSIIQALTYLKSMFLTVPEINSAMSFLNIKVIIAIIFGIIGSTPLIKRIFEYVEYYSHENKISKKIFWYLSSVTIELYVFIVLFISIIFISSDTYNPFIYFRF